MPSDQRRFAVVLGSHAEEFRGAGRYLAAVADSFPVHTLLNSASERSRVAKQLAPHVPEFTNHRIISDRLQRLTSLFSNAALVVGLGRPLDPALALVAIAQGAIFLNPSFDQPRHVVGNASRVGDAWRVSSQHSYLERFLKPPNTISVPVDQPEKLAALVKTAAGFLQKGERYAALRY